MPTWNEIIREVEGIGGPTACDQVRQKYLLSLAEQTGRPVIAYYSGFLHKKMPDGRIHPECAIGDLDMNGFMSVAHKLDRTKGLDLLLHTPGGDIEATRAIVHYLYKMFGREIRVIVPQIAMSAGTMIACAAKEVAMAKHSCLGPTDPHISNVPAMGVIAEVDRALEEIRRDPLRQLVWQQVFSKYPPGFILNCERAVAGARAMVKEWLKEGMLSGHKDPEDASEKAISRLMDISETSGHSHHFTIDTCHQFGLRVVAIEDSQDFQEAVLSVHHAFMATFALTTAIKLIENSIGGTWAVWS